MLYGWARLPPSHCFAEASTPGVTTRNMLTLGDFSSAASFVIA
jgi:hypothetical protein